MISFRPKEFIECEEPIDHKGNSSAKEVTGLGCVKVHIASISKNAFYSFMYNCI